jgi:hypothetical protein
MWLSHRTFTILVLVALLAAMLAIVLGYPLATRPLVRPGDEAIVERARGDARAIFRGAEAHDRSTFPIVVRLVDRTCVELRSWATDGTGSYNVCYDARTGNKMMEQANAGF